MTRDEALAIIERSRVSALRSSGPSHRESLCYSKSEYGRLIELAVRVCKETSPYHHGKEESS